MTTLEPQLTSLQARYTDDYPDVIKAKADLAALKKKIGDGGDQTVDEDKNPKVSRAQITQLRAVIRNDDQVITGKSKEQEQIRLEIKDLSRTHSIDAGNGAAIQGTHARISDGRARLTTTCRKNTRIPKWLSI